MRITRVFAPVIMMMLSAGLAYAGGGTALTYQGRLLDAGGPANGLFDFEFELWDSDVGGSQIGLTQVHDGISIADGLFTLQIDFGANVFDNADRWLAMTVNAVLLAPRQPITRTPYAIQTRGIFVNDDQRVGMGVAPGTARLSIEGGDDPGIFVHSGGHHGIVISVSTALSKRCANVCPIWNYS